MVLAVVTCEVLMARRARSGRRPSEHERCDRLRQRGASRLERLRIRQRRCGRTGGRSHPCRGRSCSRGGIEVALQRSGDLGDDDRSWFGRPGRDRHAGDRDETFAAPVGEAARQHACAGNHAQQRAAECIPAGGFPHGDSQLDPVGPERRAGGRIHGNVGGAEQRVRLRRASRTGIAGQREPDAARKIAFAWIPHLDVE
jgi:hypothetical protein